MNKIPSEYRPIVYIAFVFILLTIFYLIFSPYQDCKRTLKQDSYYRFDEVVKICADKTSW